ncbi:MAG: 1-acyl-sn-glycerol-3-phosphate acyltransferase [Opitutaceae bacterium]|nr:1-acyl-sn-glycerol-3-phosphate acyltransferase [Opitutaceae bacterium]
MRRAYYIVAYYLSFLLFGLVGLGLNLVCLPLLLIPRRERLGPRVRRVVRWLFAWWVKWLNACGIVRVRYHGFDRPIEGGVVVVANHPTLIDAPVLLARMPDATCIFKRALMRNPFVGPAALLAGYTSGAGGVDTVRAVARKVAAGRSLLIFPEGTRTATGAVLGPLKAGFAVIAAHGRAPVQAVIIRATPGLVARGRPWWKFPESLPACVDVTLDRRWEVDRSCHAQQFAARLEAHLREVLS